MWYKILALEERIVLDAAVGDAVQPDTEATADSPDSDLAEPVTLDADPLLAAAIPPLDPGDDVITVPEGQSSVRFSTLDLQANDPNASADFLGIRLADPNMGTLTELTPGQLYEFTVNPSYPDVPAATYDVFELELGLEFTYDVYFDIQQATNGPPIANPDMAATDYDTPIQIDVLANDTDPDGDPISLVGAEELSALGGLVTIDSVNNVIDYAPPPGVSGTDTFQYTIQDSEGNQAIGTVTIDVTEPVAVQDPILDLNGLDEAGNGFTITVDGQNFVPLVDSDALIFPDAAGDPQLDHYEFGINATSNGTFSEPLSEIQLYIPNLPAGVTIVGQNGEIVGQDNVYELSKSFAGDIETYEAVINFDSSFDPSAIESFIRTIDVNITSPQELQDIGISNLAVTLASRPSGSGLLGQLLSSDVSFNIGQVNQPPDAVDDMLMADANAPLTINVASDLLANDSDPEMDPIDLTALGTPAHGMLMDNGDGTLTYTPDMDFVGDDTFSYTISDDHGGMDTATVTIDVNEDPILDLNGLDEAGVDFTITIDGETFVPLVDSDALIFPDAAGDPQLDHYEFGINAISQSISSEPSSEIQLYIPNLPAGVTIVGRGVEIVGQDNVYELSKLIAGDFETYSAAINFDSSFDPFAIESFIRTIDVNFISPQALQDIGITNLNVTLASRPSGGGLLGQVLGSNVFIDYNLNSPPDAVDDMFTLDEDTTASINVLANDTDPDGDELMVSLVSGPANGMAALDAAGNLTYTPNANYNGPDQIVYEVSDGEFTDQATVNITVIPVNDPPVAVDDALTVGAGLEGGGNVLDNDTDVDLPDDMLHAELVSGPMHGEVILNADGTYTYEHDASYSFTDSFTYRVVDSAGASDEATVNITIAELSDAPNLKLPGLGQRLYIENGGAKLLSPAVFLKDPDSMDFDGGKLRVEISENGTMNDMLLIKENNKLWVDDAGQIFYRGELIGQVEGGDNGEALLVEFNASASAWDVARVASRIAYQNDSDNPSTDLRTVTYTVTDGDGGISNEAHRTIRFFDVNDDPEILSDSDAASAESGELINIGEQLGIQITDADLDEDGMVLVSLKVKRGNLNFSDVDDLETAIFSDELDADGMRKITFSANLDETNILLSRLTYQSKDNYSGTDYLWVKVNDLGGDGLLGGTGSDWEKFEIQVA